MLTIDEKIVFKANGVEDFVQPGEFKHYDTDLDVARYYQRFSASTNEICQKEEDLKLEVV